MLTVIFFCLYFCNTCERPFSFCTIELTRGSENWARAGARISSSHSLHCKSADCYTRRSSFRVELYLLISHLFVHFNIFTPACARRISVMIKAMIWHKKKLQVVSESIFYHWFFIFSFCTFACYSGFFFNLNIPDFF